MKYLSRFLMIAFICFSQVSCYKDNSTKDTRVLSEIGVEFTEIKTPVVNMDKNQVLTIDPVITQTETPKQLTYEWQMNYQTVSTDKKLVYNLTKLGSYFVRLKVSNSDGSTFKSFTLNVNSAYEVGLLVLAEAENGDGTLAFMRKYTDAEIAAGKVESFVNNCFTLNNPGLKLGKYPTDIAKRKQQVYITSRGEKKIYLINNKTFELETAIAPSDFPDFKPLKIAVPDNEGRSATLLCEQSKIYKLAVLEFLISADSRFPTTVIDKMALGFDDNDIYNYFWNSTTPKVHMISAYGSRDSQTEFAGRNLLQFFHNGAASYADGEFFVLTSNATNPSEVTKTVYTNNLSTIKERSVLTGGITSNITANSIIEVNPTFKKLIYANGNKIYSWFFTGTDSPADPFITIDAGVVTSMSQSTDGKILYVGIYNAAATGLKGSVYVYNMDTGALITKHLNVTDKPVKLFFKKKD